MRSDEEPAGEKEPTGEFDEWVRYEWSGTSRPSTSLIEAVAAETDRDWTDMPTLYDHVDADALNALLIARPTGTADATGATNTVTVSFAYTGFEIRLDSNGRLEIRPNVASRE